jgi:tRNA nucleotidyltransferase (CCA-adding enzyme)
VGRVAADAGLPVYIVGGAVRDLLLRRSPKDLDVAAEGPADRALHFSLSVSALPGWSLVATHRRFGTATLVAPDGLRVDVASSRTESYPRPGALPVVATGARILEDLRRRDFTIQAMARGLAADGALGPLLDPFDGRRDLGIRRLRLLHPRSLADDPTRALRAVAYAVRLGFGIDRSFRAALALARGASAFQAVSGDRLRRGLEQVLGEDDFEKAKALLARYELLDDICPGWGEGLQREISSKGGERKEREEGEGKEREEGERCFERVERAETVGVASRWTRLLFRLSPSKKKDVAERLKFSRALRRATGVPLR